MGVRVLRVNRVRGRDGSQEVGFRASGGEMTVVEITSAKHDGWSMDLGLQQKGQGWSGAKPPWGPG